MSVWGAMAVQLFTLKAKGGRWEPGPGYLDRVLMLSKVPSVTFVPVAAHGIGSAHCITLFTIVVRVCGCVSW